MPWAPFSRPKPEWFTPPKGISAVAAWKVLTPTMPVRSASAVLAASFWEFVST